MRKSIALRNNTQIASQRKIEHKELNSPVGTDRLWWRELRPHRLVLVELRPPVIGPGLNAYLTFSPHTPYPQLINTTGLNLDQIKPDQYGKLY